MSTDDRPKHYRILTSQLWIEVFRLVGAVGASQLIAQSHSPTQSTDALANLSSLYEESEVSRLLVSIASISRNLLDANAAYSREQVLRWSTPVGQLVDDLNDPSTCVDLFYRDACNKILHADEISFHRQDVDNSSRSFITSRIVLLGTRHERRWQAEIDVIRFAEYAAWVL